MTEEQQVLDTMHRILQRPERVDRTGVGTKSVFGIDMKFSLRNQFPLLTTRRITLRMIFEELMWMLRGQTDSKILVEKGVPVWEPNTTREFLDNRGLSDLREGDIGNAYGAQYRRFGAQYKGCDYDYGPTLEYLGDRMYHLRKPCGFDQLEYVINLLQEDPTSRRILMNIWNPSSLHEMSLAPCLFCWQFYVDIDEEGVHHLSAKITQRSSDISLAGGWNIATGALLVYMLSHLLGMQPNELIWSVGDCHLYLNQLEGVQTQLRRDPRPFPTLRINTTPSGNSVLERLLNFEWEHFSLENYNPHPRIKLAMNA